MELFRDAFNIYTCMCIIVYHGNFFFKYKYAKANSLACLIAMKLRAIFIKQETCSSKEIKKELLLFVFELPICECQNTKTEVYPSTLIN